MLRPASILPQGWVTRFLLYLPSGRRGNVEGGVGPVRKWPAPLSREVGSPCPQDSPSLVSLDQPEERVLSTWENPGLLTALQETPTSPGIIPVEV